MSTIIESIKTSLFAGKESASEIAKKALTESGKRLRDARKAYAEALDAFENDPNDKAKQDATLAIQALQLAEGAHTRRQTKLTEAEQADAQAVQEAGVDNKRAELDAAIMQNSLDRIELLERAAEQMRALDATYQELQRLWRVRTDTYKQMREMEGVTYSSDPSAARRWHALLHGEGLQFGASKFRNSIVEALHGHDLTWLQW